LNGHWAQAEETVDHSNGHWEGTEHGGHSITVVEVSTEYGSKGSKGGDYGYGGEYGYGYGGDYGGKSGKGSSYGYYEIVCKETEEKPHPAPEPEPAPEPPFPMPIPVSLPCPDSIQQRMNINLLTFSSHPFAISPSPLYHPCLLPLLHARVASSTCRRPSFREVW